MTNAKSSALDRRNVMLMSATAAAGSVLSTATPAAAAPAGGRAPIGSYARIPTLDLESQYDFLVAYRSFSTGDLTRAADARAEAILAANGIAPKTELPLAQVVGLLENDHILAMTGKMWLDSQRIKYNALFNELNSDADRYLSDLEAAEKKGPGTLELNPSMHIPDYCKHEIHTQIGGFCGNPFAGYLYRYGTDILYTGGNTNDEVQRAIASRVPLPANGKVRRILDLGTSVGQTATSLKSRFPEAEVWGIDIGGPMVRYAHMKATAMNVDVNFAQRLAEDTKFPDNYFDIVTANILFHEVTGDAAKKIMAETQRVLRPGGVFYPVDFHTASPKPSDAAGMYRRWWIHRWNQEVWYYDYAELDFNAELKRAGLTVPDARERQTKDPNVVAIKPA